MWPIKALFPFDSHYTEGDAWHWRFLPYQNMSALIPLLGGAEAYAKQLQFFFEGSAADPTDLLPNPLYWAGNEEDVSTARSNE